MIMEELIPSHSRLDNKQCEQTSYCYCKAFGNNRVSTQKLQRISFSIVIKKHLVTGTMHGGEQWHVM